MADLFEHYESEFQSLNYSIKRLLELVQEQRGEPRKDSIRQMERELYEANHHLESMDEETRQMTAAFRTQFSAKVRVYRMNLQELERKFQGNQDSFIDRDKANRDALLGSGQDEAQIVAMDQRERLLQGTERLGESRDVITRSHQTAQKSVKIGQEILSDLQGQRSQLEHARDDVHRTDANLKRSRKTMRKIGRRAFINLILIFCVIIVLLVVIFLIVFFVWIYPLIKKWAKK